MRILMTGPGYGHNIQPWLEYYQNRPSNYELCFFCSRFQFPRDDFEQIHIIEFGQGYWRFIRALRSIKQIKFDVLYIHGANNPVQTLLFLYLVNHSQSVINIWGHTVLERSCCSNLWTRLLYRHAFRLVNFVCLNWHGTKNRFERDYPDLKAKAVLTPWGLHKDWLQEIMPAPSNFTRDFLARIEPHTIVCFWPKSPTRQSRLDLVVKALGSLANDKSLLDNFALYIWPGNVQDPAYRLEIEALIQEYQLENRVFFIDHPYVPFTDMFHLWQRANFGINIVDYDQLSTTILEPMLVGKDILLSDIESYRALNNKYQLDLHLVKNTVDEIAAGLRSMIEANQKPDQATLDHRSRVVKDEFQFDRNIDKIMHFLQAQLR